MNIDKIKELIESVKEYDYASLTADDIKYYLLDYKELAIAVVVVLVSLVMSYQSYSGAMNEKKEVAYQVDELNQKITPSIKYQKIFKELDKFKEEFPEFLSERKLISEITNFANTFNVDIRSLSAPQKNKHGFYEEITIQLECEAHEYLDFAKFIQAVENAPYAMRVDRLGTFFRADSAGNKGRRANVANEDVKKLIVATLTITVIGLEN